ncbi:MAG: DUF2157 domain-containing protein [Ruminococcus sp.]|nr:DUF2157 domain-containing protein [Ruminococcus sp.]
MAGTDLTFALITLFFKMSVPLVIIGVIIFLVVTDTNKKKGSVPVQYDAQGRPIPAKTFSLKGKFNTSTVLLIIGTSFIMLSAVTFVAANWVKLSDAAKVFIILGAAIVSLIISVILKALAKLDLTSAAFYIIGASLSVVSLFTAGSYRLFGEWYSFRGDGAALLCATGAFIIAVAAMLAYPLYKKIAFAYIGLSFVSIFLLFLAIQITDSYEQFAPVIIMVQFLITAAVHILKPQKGTRLDLPVRVIGDITSTLFAVFAFMYVLWTTFSATPFTFFILGVIIVQCFLYGILKKQSWLFVVLNIVAVYTAFVAVFGLKDKYGTDFVMVFFSFIALAIYVVNLFAPKKFAASKVIALGFAVLGAFMALLADNDRYFGMNLVVPIAVSFIITCYTLHKELGIQITAGICAPILPFFTALYLNNRLFELGGRERYNEILTLTFGGLVIVYMAATVILMSLPKIAFNFHAHHPLKTELVLYSNMVVAGAVLLCCTGYSDLFAVTIAVCILHFIVSHFMSCNITAAGSVISLILLTYRILAHFFENEDIPMFSMFGLFVVLLVISRFLFPESLITKKKERTHTDVLLLSSWMCVVGFPTFNRLSIFLRLMAIAVFLACFIKRKTNKDAAAVMLSCSAFIAALACITRPFLMSDSSIINSKITLAIIALLGVAYRFIWKNHKLASKITSTVLFVIAFIGLIIDAMVFHSAANTIFVLGTTVAILLIAFYTKNKTWFAVSSIALVVITIYSTRKYFAEMGWWIYLFIVGIILIAVAAVNEFCKKKGLTMKSAATKTFSEWNW